jgi:outer membrane protein assembly factor BamB
LLGLSVARAENWPQWRGAKLDGISHEKGLPTKWSKTEGIVWRLPLPGPAGATPVVWDDRIYLTSADGADLIVMCVGTDGKELWRRTLATGDKNVRVDEGNAASPSPVTDGQHVWAMMTTGDLACYTKEGQEVWKINLQDRYGEFHIQFGMTSSPLLDGSRLYLQLIHGEMRGTKQEAKVVCLDAATGNEVWAVERQSDGTFENKHSYASPVMYRDAEQTFLLTHGNDYIVAHDLKDGREIWRCGDLNPKGNYEPTLRFVASPLAVPGYIVVPTAKNRGVVCLKPGGKGDITDAANLAHWKRDNNTPDVPSPLLVDGLVYLCRENGNMMCLDANTGTEHYIDQQTTRDRHRASPVYADGHIYTTARKGVVTVLKAGPKFEIVAQNDLGESTSASPAISGGRIYLRTFDALYAIGK